MTQATDPNGTYGFTYDNMGRLTQTSTQYSFVTRALAVSYTYDAASNRLTMVDPEGGTPTNYSYDTLNRLYNLADHFGNNFAFSFDALSRRIYLARRNNVSSGYTYDAQSQLTSVLHVLSAGRIDGANYIYDPAGNRTSKTNQLNNVTSLFAYDPIYELKTVTQGTQTPENYTYDAVGNRLASVGVSPYSYNNSNQLTSIPGTTYAYDSNGNTLSKTPATGATGYAWDFENRLTSVTLPGTGGTVSFKYDPFGRRIQKVLGSATTNYVYDGDSIVEELNSSGAATTRYTQGLGIDEPLALTRAGATYYYEADGLGSITTLTDSTGAPAAGYVYDSFGNATVVPGSIANPYRYTAREFDSETALYYYRARYYDPTEGRFLNEDPMRFLTDANFYRYVSNNPISFVDPFGLTCTCTYHQSTGVIRCVDDTTGQATAQGTGYSGIGSGLNNPAMQDVQNTGPITQGSYSFGRPNHRKGPLTIPLIPRPGTNTLGRSGFLMHGDNPPQNHTASHGCVIQSHNVRQEVADCGGGILNVIQ